MNRKSALLCILLVIIIVLYAHRAQATVTKVFYSDGVIEAGDVYNKVQVYDTDPLNTTVNMIGGHVGDPTDDNSGMFTYDSSTVNISGGTVAYLQTYNSSIVNISGGLVGNWVGWPSVSAHDSSAVNVYDGGFLTGGSFSLFDLYESATLNVYGGDVGLFLEAYNSSIVNIYDGDLYQIIPLEGSVVNVHGGYIRTFAENTPVPTTATVNIYGYGFSYDPEAEWRYWDDPADGWWVSKLTGLGPDGTVITYWGLPDPATHPNINLIPEPSIVVLLGLGGFGLLRKRRAGENYSK